MSWANKAKEIAAGIARLAEGASKVVSIASGPAPLPRTGHPEGRLSLRALVPIGPACDVDYWPKRRLDGL
jgi:hypothetical protein